jgi:hypothetical protein
LSENGTLAALVNIEEETESALFAEKYCKKEENYRSVNICKIKVGELR